MRPIEEFFSLVLPMRGTRVLCELTEKGVRNHTYVEGTSVTEIAGDALAMDAEGKTVYMALGGFEHETVARYKGRTAENARWFRSLWLDIDVGESKDYKTPQEAATAIAQFVNETHVPPPTLVHSGYGWHVYWPLLEDVALSDWRVAAQGLHALAMAKGLRIDSRCTMDAARILRPVETHNYKKGASKIVRVVKASETVALATLKQYFTALPLVALAAAAPINGAVHAFGLGAVDVSRPEQFSAAKILNGCQQFRWAMGHQVEVKEPMWRAMVGTLYRTDNPAIIHEFSRLHPGYSHEETEKKARGWTGGGVTCAALEAERPAGCIGCPKKGIINSPSWFGAHTVIEPLPPVEIDQDTGMPRSWMQKDNSLYLKTEEGPQLLYRGRIEFGTPFKEQDPASKNDTQYLPIIGRTHRDTHPLYLHMGMYASSQELRKAFATVGIIPEVRSEREFFNGMRAWIQEITEKSTSVKPVRQMGWQSHESSDTSAGFVLGTTLYLPGDRHEVRVGTTAEKHSRHMKPEGSFDEWKRAINMYNRPEYAHYALMSWLMFGAPLARLLGSGMPIAHFNSQGSGHGKTGTQDLLLSGAGNPRDPNGRWTGNTTIISIYTYLTAMNGNIAVLDETSAIQPEVLSKLMFEATLGSGRKAMQGATGGTRDLPPITGILCTSGNMSLQQLAQSMKGNSEAQVARVFEFNVRRPDMSKEQRYADGEVFKLVYENYGHAMPVYIEYIVNHQMDVKALMADVERRLIARFGMQNEERFWRALLTVCITGARIAKGLKLIDHDVNKLLPAAFAHYDYQRAALSEETQQHHALYQFVQDNQSAVIAVSSDTPILTNQLKLVTVVRAPAAHVNVRMRYVIDSGYLYVDRGFLRAYCTEKNLDFRTLIAQTKQEGWLLFMNERRNLAGYTRFSTPARPTCLCFDMKKAKAVMDLLKRME